MYIKLKQAEYRLYSLAIQHYYIMQHKRLSPYEEYNSVYHIMYEVLNCYCNENQRETSILLYVDETIYYKGIKALDYFESYIDTDNDLKLCDIFNHLVRKLIDSQRRN